MVILLQERKRLGTRAKPSMRNVLFVMSVSNPLGHSSLSEERTSACVDAALTLVMLRSVNLLVLLVKSRIVI